MANAAPVLEALSDPTRRRIFELLAEHPSPVALVAERLPVTRPAVSQHIKVLKDAGLVRDERDGARRIYTVDLDGLEPVRAYLDGFWRRSLDAFKQAAEHHDDEENP